MAEGEFIFGEANTVLGMRKKVQMIKNIIFRPIVSPYLDVYHYSIAKYILER